MTGYCRSLVSEGRYTFPCPYADPITNSSCNRRWEFFLVAHVALLTSDERRDIEQKLIENYGNKAAGIQRCPGCLNFCRRKDRHYNCVVCIICTSAKKQLFQFCWACLGEWKYSVTGWCGNDDCDGLDGRIRTLAICGTKRMTYSKQACPTIRGCPKCVMLIEHKEACKHMDCPACKHGFCFVCLKGKKAGGTTWKCGSFSGTCKLAPRQTVLPGSE